MCIGIPMRVQQAGDGEVPCVDAQGQSRRVRTALVGPARAGEWLLVFLSDAVARLDADRAAEINHTLALVRAAANGAAAAAEAANAPAPFTLPSQLSPAALARMTS
ncbi:MAG: HypC/HybG/HupF family hydrogenase formation chaperone [Proteobacteria bacterium]|nr:HypC/HybG/HupF family hydrogenase formation chaperone [Pseudomonadota bacterium]